MRKLLLLTAVLGLAVSAGAQDLDTVNITDQFSTGIRGNVAGSGTFGASETDPNIGIESTDYSGADATGTPITYTNTYANDANETPVVNVVGATHPDRSASLAITANTQAGAASASDVLLVSDDGGTNNLIFGEGDDANYFVEVDVFTPDESANTAGTHNLTYVAIRAARDGDTTDFSWTVDREDSYALAYNSQTLEVKAVQYASGTSTGDAGLYTSASWAEEFGSTSVTGDAWHTFRIEANGDRIVFSVDGTTVANVVDADVTNGRAILGWREVGGATDEFPAVFDNLKAGPSAGNTSVETWSLYQY